MFVCFLRDWRPEIFAKPLSLAKELTVQRAVWQVTIIRETRGVCYNYNIVPKDPAYLASEKSCQVVQLQRHFQGPFKLPRLKQPFWLPSRGHLSSLSSREVFWGLEFGNSCTSSLSQGPPARNLLRCCYSIKTYELWIGLTNDNP